MLTSAWLLVLLYTRITTRCRRRVDASNISLSLDHLLITVCLPARTSLIAPETINWKFNLSRVSTARLRKGDDVCVIVFVAYSALPFKSREKLAPPAVVLSPTPSGSSLGLTKPFGLRVR